MVDCQEPVEVEVQVEVSSLDDSIVIKEPLVVVSFVEENNCPVKAQKEENETEEDSATETEGAEETQNGNVKEYPQGSFAMALGPLPTKEQLRQVASVQIVEPTKNCDEYAQIQCTDRFLDPDMLMNGMSEVTNQVNNLNKEHRKITRQFKMLKRSIQTLKKNGKCLVDTLGGILPAKKLSDDPDQGNAINSSMPSANNTTSQEGVTHHFSGKSDGNLENDVHASAGANKTKNASAMIKDEANEDVGSSPVGGQSKIEKEATDLNADNKENPETATASQ